MLCVILVITQLCAHVCAHYNALDVVNPYQTSYTPYYDHHRTQNPSGSSPRGSSSSGAAQQNPNFLTAADLATSLNDYQTILKDFDPNFKMDVADPQPRMPNNNAYLKRGPRMMPQYGGNGFSGRQMHSPYYGGRDDNYYLGGLSSYKGYGYGSNNDDNNMARLSSYNSYGLGSLGSSARGGNNDLLYPYQSTGVKGNDFLGYSTQKYPQLHTIGSNSNSKPPASRLQSLIRNRQQMQRSLPLMNDYYDDLQSLGLGGNRNLNYLQNLDLGDTDNLNYDLLGVDRNARYALGIPPVRSTTPMPLLLNKSNAVMLGKLVLESLRKSGLK